MSRLLVTGATGMLGSHVALYALETGWRVRGLVRSPGGADSLAVRGVELVLGNVQDAEAVRRAADGCDAVVHAAAAIGSRGPADPYMTTNVVGTRNVLEAARAASARMVHVSSTAVIGMERYAPGAPLDESMPLPDLPAWDAYGRSKQAAEREVARATRSGAVWVTTVRPPLMYGRRDRQFVPRVAATLSRGLAPLVGSGRNTLPLVHAASVAEGILAALAHDGANGRIYNLTEDRPVTGRTLLESALRGLGVRAAVVRLPRPLAAAGFVVLAGALTLAGRVDLARHARGTFMTLTRENPFSAARARAELGWRPNVRPDAAIEDAFRWWSTRRGGGDT